MPDEPTTEAAASALSQEEYRAVFRSSPDGILLCDADGRMREVNPRLGRMFGYERSELVGEPVELLVPEARRREHRVHREDYVANPRTRPMGLDLELKGRRKDGSIFPVEISLSPLAGESGLLIIATVRDVSARRRLQEFGAGALRAAEDERRRIARELHDDTAQRLSGLLIRLRLAAEGSSEERRRALRELREEIVEIAEGIRRIARGLRPPALEDAGLAAAIRSHVRRLRETSDVSIQVDADRVEPLLDQDRKLALYRIVQEALSNVVRHADASRARVEIEVDDAGLAAAIEDDGRGFDPRSADEGVRGLGLIGMRERARNAGGSLDVESEIDGGTVVRVSIPGLEG